MPLPSILDRRVSARLTDAILSLQPTALLVPDGTANLRDLTNRWPAAITGAPVPVAAPSPIDRALAYSGTGMYATTSGSIPQSDTISVLAFMQTTDATASSRSPFARVSSGGNSCWNLFLDASQQATFGIMTSAGGYVAAAVSATGVNDGRWWMLAGTATEGTTDLWGYACSSTGVFTAVQDNTWSGTWNRTAFPIRVATTSGAAALFPGTVGPAAYWAGRVLAAADLRYIASVAFGG